MFYLNKLVLTWMTPVVKGRKNIMRKFFGFSESSPNHLWTGALSITLYESRICSIALQVGTILKDSLV